MGRWGSLALGLLLRGPFRFAQLRDRLSGISEKVLTDTLRNLERDGIVERRLLGGVPPGVEYSLTPLGIEFARRVDALIDWIEEQTPAIVSAQNAWRK